MTRMYNPNNPEEFVEFPGDGLVEFYEGHGWKQSDYVDMPAILGEPATVTFTFADPTMGNATDADNQPEAPSKKGK